MNGQNNLSLFWTNASLCKIISNKNAFQWDAYWPLQWPPLDVITRGCMMSLPLWYHVLSRRGYDVTSCLIPWSFHGYLVLRGVCSRGRCLLLGGVPGSGGVSGPGGDVCLLGGGGMYLVTGGLLLGGVPGPRGSVPGQVLPPGQTDACKHITLHQTSFAGGNKVLFSLNPD